jgi:hypothetical protein
MTYTAWAYLGNLDAPAARRFLRRSILVGTIVAAVTATAAIFVSLMVTATMQVTLLTLLLLIGQTAYLLGASALLMTGKELRLLVALVPAVVGAGIGLWQRRAAVVGPLAPVEPPRYPELVLLGASVVLTVVFALVGTRKAARPAQPLPRAVWPGALMHAAYGLLIALLVLYPALNELLTENYEALPLSVTLAALPLVLSMGVAEGLLHEHRRTVRRLLATTASPAEFARAARRALGWTQLRFAGVLAALTSVLALGVATLGPADARVFLIGADYLLIGTAVFAAMALILMGRIGIVLAGLTAAVAALLAFNVAANFMTTDSASLLWLGAVGAVLSAVFAALVHRYIVRTVSHW